VRSILRFVFVVVPTAVLAGAVVVGISGKDRQVTALDGDLQRDLKLASTESIELAPAGQPLATVSAIEASPRTELKRTVRPKRSGSVPRAVRARTPRAATASEIEVPESVDASETGALELSEAPQEAEATLSADGGVALPRPTPVPVAYPGPVTVIRGGSIDPDHCQIHGGRGRPVYRPPVYAQPRGITLGDRIRAAQAGGSRTPSLGDRIRGSSSSGSRSSIGARVRETSSRPRSESGGRTLGERVRAARGR